MNFISDCHSIDESNHEEKENCQHKFYCKEKKQKNEYSRKHQENEEENYSGKFVSIINKFMRMRKIHLVWFIVKQTRNAADQTQTVFPGQ